MAVTFPSLKPSSRSITVPKYPITTSTSQSGVLSKRLWGSKPSQLTLSLGFNNISDANAALILSAYSSAQGSVTELTLPTEVFSAISNELSTWVTNNSTSGGLKWYFSEGDPPSVESVVPGRSTVRVTLVAELRLS